MPSRAPQRELLSEPAIQTVLLNGSLEGLIVAGKFVTALAMGRPLLWIGATNGESGGLIRAFGCGVIARPDSAAALAEVLHELRENCATGSTRLRTTALRAQTL